MENKTFASKFWLEEVLSQKIKMNPNYSLRAFARKVAVSPSVLSRILSGKRKLTFGMAIRLADALDLAPKERKRLYATISHNKKNQIQRAPLTSYELSVDAFNTISEWYHYGICQMLFLEDFKEDHNWMANFLNISVLELKLALECLLRLGLLARDKSGNLYRTAQQFSTTTDVASQGLRTFQKQILEKALISLGEDQITERDITSITVATNEDQIANVKKEIKKFRLKISEILGQGPKTRIYNLGIHLIPLSDSTKRKKYDN